VTARTTDKAVTALDRGLGIYFFLANMHNPLLTKARTKPSWEIFVAGK
jgi:hypothetical protein